MRCTARRRLNDEQKERENKYLQPKLPNSRLIKQHDPKMLFFSSKRIRIKIVKIYFLLFRLGERAEKRKNPRQPESRQCFLPELIFFIKLLKSEFSDGANPHSNNVMAHFSDRIVLLGIRWSPQRGELRLVECSWGEREEFQNLSNQVEPNQAEILKFNELKRETRFEIEQKRKLQILASDWSWNVIWKIGALIPKDFEKCMKRCYRGKSLRSSKKFFQ